MFSSELVFAEPWETGDALWFSDGRIGCSRDTGACGVSSTLTVRDNGLAGFRRQGGMPRNRRRLSGSRAEGSGDAPAGGKTEQVRQAIAFMHTGGKMGERQADDLMMEVAVATRSTDLDQKRLGMTTWCEIQKTKLAGFVRRKELN